ncbi:HAMP domain-containing protein [Desulfobacterales bacterium HSG16]|nr:HAMP domain-containing protein [Desulfobacterales bacterium HSG16]
MIKNPLMGISIVKSSGSGVYQKLLKYFIILMLISMAAGCTLLYEIRGIGILLESFFVEDSAYTDNGIDVSTSDGNGAGRDFQDKAEQIHYHWSIIKYRVAGVTLMAFLLMLTVLHLFIRNVVDPLDKMAIITREMAEGRLDQLLPIKTRGDIGHIGSLINELAMNLQEILLYAWNNTTYTLRILDKIEQCHNPENSKDNRNDSCANEIRDEKIRDEKMQDGVEENIGMIREHLEDMRSMIRAFDYYDVRIEDDKVLGENVPGQKENG